MILQKIKIPTFQFMITENINSNVSVCAYVKISQRFSFYLPSLSAFVFFVIFAVLHSGCSRLILDIGWARGWGTCYGFGLKRTMQHPENCPSL